MSGLDGSPCKRARVIVNPPAAGPVVTEGTWTLTMGDGITNFSLLGVQSTFTRIDNLVALQFGLRVVAKNAAVPASDVQVSLPFPAATGGGNRASLALGDASFINSGTDRVSARITSGSSTFFVILRTPPLAAQVTLTVADFDDGTVPGNGVSRLSGSGVYHAIPL